MLYGCYELIVGGLVVNFYVGYYCDQYYGCQLIMLVNDFVNDEVEKYWFCIVFGCVELDGKVWCIVEFCGQVLDQVSGDGSCVLCLCVWQIYWINGQFFVSDWQVKFYGVWCSLFGQGDDVVVVIVYVDKLLVGVDDVVLCEFLCVYWMVVDIVLCGVWDCDVV